MDSYTGLIILAQTGSKIKVETPEGSGVYMEGVILSIQSKIAEIRFQSGETEFIHLGSQRLFPISRVTSNPKLLKYIYTKREHAGEIIQAPLPVTKPKIYSPHNCGVECMFELRPEAFRKVSPFLIPLKLGWYRQIAKAVNKGVVGDEWRIFYVTPCGRRLRNIREIALYLDECSSNMPIDFFTFDAWVNVRDVFAPMKGKVFEEDITGGKEFNPISFVNYFDETRPNAEYCCELQPQGDVKIPSDPEFLVGCTCTNNCQDHAVCACTQLTIKATALDKEEKLVLKDASYDHRRLKDVLITGVFECNSKCSCSSSCHNRVHQQPIKVQLQVFKTENRGFGVRALHDIPQGMFVCNYIGNLFNSNDANEEGKKFGDEYHCELDLIDIVERRKDGYESDVEDIEDIEALEENGAASNQLTKEDATEPPLKKQRLKSIKDFYPEEENVFLVDARRAGNVGRYLNHSCDPNVFVQNVFHETHDLRFPKVAFFTSKFVKAGEELCWNYNYVVGSVTGKRVYCFCGERYCSQRLL